jgi:hypothetical protein
MGSKMILSGIATEVLREAGVPEEKIPAIALQIERKYKEAVDEILIELEPKAGKAFQLDPSASSESIDPEFLIDPQIREIESDSLPRESTTHKEPAEVPPAEAGFINSTVH